MKQRSSYVEYILQRTGGAENRWMESLTKRVAEINETKLLRRVSHYAFKALFEMSCILVFL